MICFSKSPSQPQIKVQRSIAILREYLIQIPLKLMEMELQEPGREYGRIWGIENERNYHAETSKFSYIPMLAFIRGIILQEMLASEK
jgi:hypothetical protein